MITLAEQLKIDNDYIPNAWRPHLEPHTVYAPAGYHSHKCAAAGIARMMLDCQVRFESGQMPVGTAISALAACYCLVKEKVPVYYVDEQFIRAVAETDIPADFMISELKWPRDACVFAFPERFMEQYLGAKLSYVWAANADGRDIRPPAWYVGPTIMPGTSDRPNRAKVYWFSYAMQEGRTASWASAFFTDEPAAQVVGKYGYTEYRSDISQEVSNQSKDFADRLSALMLKLLLVYTTRPSFAQPGATERPAKLAPDKRTVIQREVRSPNFIGRGYKISTAPAGAVGTHASPSLHVRRRHFAYVAIGKRNAPDFVSAKTMPRRADGEIDWDRVEPAVREAFLRYHRREWIDQVLVGAKA